MQRKFMGRKALAVGVVFGLSGLLAACSSGTTSSETSAAPAATEAAASAAPAAPAATEAAASAAPAAAGTCINDVFGAGGPEAGQGVTIPAGMLLAVTGQGSFFGDVMSKGALLAADQIREAGGMDYQITIGDHKSGDVPTAITETKRLISQDGIEVLQTSYGAPSEAIIPIFQEAGVLTFNGGGSSPAQLNQDLLYMNRMVYAEDPAPGALAWIHQTYPDATKLALIGTMENGVGTFKETAPAAWKALTGGEIVAAEQHDVGATDFKALAAKIKAANPDAIMTFSFGDDLGYQVKALREAGITAPIMMDEFTSQAAKIGGSAYDGVNFGVDFYTTDNPNPWNQCFVAAHQAKYGEDPEYYGSNYYEQVFIVWELVKRVIAAGGDPNDAAQLQEALLADPTFKSVYGGDASTVGMVALDPVDHSISKPMGVFEVQGGVPTLLTEIHKIKNGEDPMTALGPVQ